MCWTTGKQTLVECEACKRPVSIEAAACPGCGHPRVQASVKGLIRCRSCNQPHAIDATVCPRCGQPHDPVATRAGIDAEREEKSKRAVQASKNTRVLALVVVVVVASLCCLSQPLTRRVEYVTVPDPVAAPLPAEHP